jgi:hypothetical protein
VGEHGLDGAGEGGAVGVHRGDAGQEIVVDRGDGLLDGGGDGDEGGLRPRSAQAQEADDAEVGGEVVEAVERAQLVVDDEDAQQRRLACRHAEGARDLGAGDRRGGDKRGRIAVFAGLEVGEVKVAGGQQGAGAGQPQERPGGDPQLLGRLARGLIVGRELHRGVDDQALARGEERRERVRGVGHAGPVHGRRDMFFGTCLIRQLTGIADERAQGRQVGRVEHQRRLSGARLAGVAGHDNPQTTASAGHPGGELAARQARAGGVAKQAQAEQVDAGRAGLDEREAQRRRGALAQAQHGGADDRGEGPLALGGSERCVGIDEAGEHAVGGVCEARGGVQQAGVGERHGEVRRELRGGDERQGDDEDVAGVDRRSGDADDLATGAQEHHECGASVLAGGGGVDLQAQLGGVRERPGKRRGAQLGDGHGRRLDRLDQPGPRRRRCERLGVELEVGAADGDGRAVDLGAAAGEDPQGLDVLGARVQELTVDGRRDRQAVGLGLRVELHRHDDDPLRGAQPGAQRRHRGEGLTAMDLRADGLDGVLTAEQRARVGPHAQPHLREVLVADDAGVVGRLAQAVAADHAAEREAGD